MSNDLVQTAQALCNDQRGGDAEWCADNWGESLSTAESMVGSIDDVFDRAVAALSTPRITTASELKSEIDLYHRNWHEVDEEIYKHFLDHVEYRLLGTKTSEPISICRVDGLPECATAALERTFYFHLGNALARAEILGTEPEVTPPADSDSSEAESEVDARADLLLWEANGVTLACECIEVAARQQHFRAPETEHLKSGLLCARLHGRMSPEALESLQSELIPIVQANIGSAALLRCALSMTPARGSGWAAEHRHSPGVIRDDSGIAIGQKGIRNRSDDASNARRLAAAFLYAVWFRCDFQRAMGERPQLPDDVLAELRQRKWEGGLPARVPDVAAIRSLWAPGKSNT